MAWMTWPLAAVAGHPALQPLVDATPSGGVLRPQPGIYAGPVTVSRPMTIDGGGKVTIDGGGRGSVLTINVDGAVLRGLRLIRSGDSHDRLDAGIAVQGNGNRIEDNVVDDTLFGISLKQSNRNLVARNRIRSKPAELAMRGDGLRLWYSMDNRIEGNDIAGARDVVFQNSPRNRVVGNVIRNGRYGMQFVFSPQGTVERNQLSRNSTGVVVLNSDGMTIRRNHIAHAMEASGACLAFKKTTEVVAEGNDLVHCAVGILSDSPPGEANRIVLTGNRIVHSVTGIVFYGEKGGHTIHGNHFENNLAQVVVYGSGDAAGNDWLGNYWDDYQGFDRDGDGVGDTPYDLYAYADRIWMEIPKARFFRNSPVLELLDFLERLAPFSSPDLILRDRAPRFRRGAAQGG